MLGWPLAFIPPPHSIPSHSLSLFLPFSFRSLHGGWTGLLGFVLWLEVWLVNVQAKVGFWDGGWGGARGVVVLTHVLLCRV